jgi:ATP-dependent DNA helicase RecG
MSFSSIYSSISELPGLGPKRTKLFHHKDLYTVQDLLLSFPRSYDDRRELISVKDALSLLGRGESKVRILSIAQVMQQEYFGFRKSRTLKVSLDDGTGTLALLCFGRNFLAKQLIEGSWVIITATVKLQFNELQSSQFEFTVLAKHLLEEDSNLESNWKRIVGTKQFPQIGKLLPIYSLTEGLSQQIIRKTYRTILDNFSHYLEIEQEILPETILRKHSLIPLKTAITEIHEPSGTEVLEKAHFRLAFEEIFLFQLANAWRKINSGSGKSLASIEGTTHLDLPRTLMEEVRSTLPFQLTKSQTEIIDSIIEEMGKQATMNRLLQGDVGSGKTITAILSALPIIEQGHQTLLLCPTEVLAKQHYLSVSKLLSKHSIQVDLLVGSLETSKRKSIEESIKSGKTQLIIGTHASFSKKVRYSNLKYLIVDEQHRFGVEQRNRALRKGKTVHCLSMSATPIPRSLALGLFSTTEICELREKPKNRLAVKTHLAKMTRDNQVYDFVKRQIDQGYQAYFVYPRIEEDRESSGFESPFETARPIKSVEQMYQELQTDYFSNYTLGLLHSRLSEEEKSSVMEKFQSGKCQILVATSMVELGLDNPNANCLVVEHAERFGLASLHQLRGRVGRSDIQSYCFFVYEESLSDLAKERMRTLHESSDGFYIAEMDLKLRGPGDLGGLQQSGFLGFKTASFPKDFDLLGLAREDAELLLNSDPELKQADNHKLKQFLQNEINTIWEKFQ